MKTAQISKLLENNNNKLISLNLRISERMAVIVKRARVQSPERAAKLLADPLTKALKQRVEDEYSARIALLTVGACHTQIESYLNSRFDRNFSRLQTIRANQYISTNDGSARAAIEQDIELRNKAWEALPNSPFKRFQEIFCEPRNYIVPRFFVERDGRIAFLEGLEQRCCSVQPCLVSPHLIPDELAQTLGLVAFTAKERRSPLARHLRKAQDDVMQGIKQRWDNTFPLAERAFRVVVIQKPGKAEREAHAVQYPHAPPMPPGLHGSLLMTREDPARSPNPTDKVARMFEPKDAKPRQMALFISIFSALRKTGHQRAGADTEITQIASFKTKLEGINTRIRTTWRKDIDASEKEEILKELRETAHNGLALLAGDTERRKREAAARIDWAKECKDSLGRLNPMSTSEQLTKVIRLLTQRTEDIAYKGGYNETDRQLIIGHIAHHKSVVSSAVQSFRTLVSEKFGEPKWNENLRKIVRDNESQLKSVIARPFATFASALRVYGRALSAALNHQEPTINLVKSALFVGAMCDALLNLERIKVALTMSESPTFSTLLNETKEFQETLKSADAGSDPVRMQKKTEFQDVGKRIAAHLDCFTAAIKSERSLRVWSGTMRKLADEPNIEELISKESTK